MTGAAIAQEVEAFVRDHILAGQGEGLTAATPLLELGILDSFGLFKLVAHLNDAYAVEIAADQIDGRDFRTIDAIADLVARRRAAAAGPTRAAVAQSATDGVAVFEVPDCAQVFIMFLGARGLGGRGAAGDAVLDESPEFFKHAGLGDRNIILFHDGRGSSYREGVSADLPTRASIYERLSEWLAQRPHVEEIYCIGVSAGGPMAMLAGDFLKATTVWAFAPRTARRDLTTHAELARVVEQVTGKPLRDLQQGLAPEDEAKIDAHMTPEVVDAYYRTLLDPDVLLDAGHLASVVDTLSQGSGLTEHRIYYVPRDACDARVAEALKPCPGVRLCPLEPSDAPPPTWAFSRWIHPMRWVCRDHLVLDLLRQRGQFSTLFPAFRAVATAVARV